MNRKTIVLEVLNKLIDSIDLKSSTDRMIGNFKNECLYLKQEIEEGRINLPLTSIQGYLLSYIIAEDYFYNNTELKNLSEVLYENIVLHDI